MYSPYWSFTLRCYLLTYSMVQSPSWSANWFAASQEIPLISRNPNVHYLTHKLTPPVSVLGQPNPVHIPTSYLLEIHPYIIHPSTPRFLQWCRPNTSANIVSQFYSITFKFANMQDKRSCTTRGCPSVVCPALHVRCILRTNVPDVCLSSPYVPPSHVCPIVPKAVTCLHILLHYNIAAHSCMETSERFSHCCYISSILRHEHAKAFNNYAGQVT